MGIPLSEVRDRGFVDKVILHCHDQSLYLVSVIIDEAEIYVTDSKGNFLKSFNKLELQAMFADLEVGAMVLRHKSPYDEMIGLPPGGDNTLEVLIGGIAYAARTDPKTLH